MDTFKATILKRIRDARKQAGLTQDDMAGLLGVTRVTVVRWEKEGRGLDLDQIERIMRCLGCDSLRLLDVGTDKERDWGPLLQAAGELNENGLRYLEKQAAYLTYVPEFNTLKPV